MTAPVIHQPRVAWDAARAVVRAAQTPYYAEFAQQMMLRVGHDHYLLLEDTRARVLDNYYRTGGDRFVIDLEAGKWRIRFEELLQTRPDLVPTVLELTSMVPRF